MNRLLCALVPNLEAPVGDCPCVPCRAMRRGIKDDFDVNDLEELKRAQIAASAALPLNLEPETLNLPPT